MAVDKFKFVSPGVFIDEIDESILEPLPERMGPLVIGRFRKGPSGRPVKVDSFKDLVATFGAPSDGNVSGDIWRKGEPTAPTYAAYAAQAWLKNNSPCTVYRVLGNDRDDASTTGTAGWKLTNTFAGSANGVASEGGAYGLFILPNPDSHSGGTAATATLRCLDGDAAHGLTAGQKITLTSLDGTIVDYFISDIDNGGRGNLGSVTNGTVLGGGGSITATLTAGAARGIAVGYNLGGSNKQQQVLQLLKAAIEHAGGHGGKIIVGSIADTPTDGPKDLALTQSAPGSAGNTTTTEDLATISVQSDFANGVGPSVTGSLAAIWYVDGGAVVLSGSARDGGTTEGAGVLIKDSNGTFTAKITGSSGPVKTATFDFNRDSKTFIRNVFNTDPTKVNSLPLHSTREIYWLGETFESNVTEGENSQLLVSGSPPASSDKLGVILALDGTNGGSQILWANHKQGMKAAETGYFFSQDIRGATTASFNPRTAGHVKNLFKFVALDSGEHANRDYKISIQDIKPSPSKLEPFGTFSILVRSAYDNDNNPVILERFSNVNLNPNSLNYIQKVIGDREFNYDQTNKTITELGNYPNRSKYVRVVVSDDVNSGDAGRRGYLPYGVFGPVVPQTLPVVSGSTVHANVGWIEGDGALADDILTHPGHTENHIIGTSNTLSLSVEWPVTRLRVSASEGGLVKPTQAYFGYQSNLIGTKRHDSTNIDILRGAPAGLDPHGSVDDRQYSWAFTLDDLKSVSGSESGQLLGEAEYKEGSRAAGTSFSAQSGSSFVLTGSVNGVSYAFNRFTSPMFGGFDGFDITEKDPLRNGYLSTNQNERDNYAFHSLKRAIDIASDAEFIEFDVTAMPGITNNSLNTQLINACEERGDAIAIVDLPGNFTPKEHSNLAESARLGSVDEVVQSAKDLALNTSYGCTFYPYVQIRDSISDSVLYVPPSVVALGTFSSAQRKSAVWFAPAGFTRGGLSEGSAGLPVIGVRQRLTADDRDRLYDVNINPIASFPAEGIVIFGQKTLQVTPSALDRINVRRLLIFVKKEISRIASRTLFEQNVSATWDRFKGQVIPFLEGVQAGLGLTDFRVILDDTTTTPDLVDRNILYAKIFLKPARAIEFIALDFIITKSGASFDD